jgi:hypothetical protein
MTQPSLLDPPALTAPSMTAIVAAYFKARPGQRVSAMTIQSLGARLSVTQEISRLRKPPYLMHVANFQRREGRRVVESWYVYTPEAQ